MTDAELAKAIAEQTRWLAEEAKEEMFRESLRELDESIADMEANQQEIIERHGHESDWLIGLIRDSQEMRDLLVRQHDSQFAN